MQEPTIVFFDGYCGLCNNLVDFLIQRDHLGKLHFAPLQGSTAATKLTEAERNDLDSIVVFHAGVKLKHSNAVLAAVSQTGGLLGLLAQISKIFPAIVRDFVYRIVAKNRYAWFGKLDACRLPTPEERSRFLD
ncbi:MAG: DCC1-like thiol-disulfide oxidoreductase family protein [Bdellovibrionota bacterium]